MKFFLLILLPIVALGCTDGGTAQHDADAWIHRQGLNATAECADMDSDGDGYVSCTMVVTDPNGSKHIEPLECAGRYTLNKGCRAPKPTVRAR